MERDAITGEEIDPNASITMDADDGGKLSYNVSTLSEAAQRHGQWMQPPLFNQPMHQHLVERVERINSQIEGRKTDAKVDGAFMEDQRNKLTISPNRAKAYEDLKNGVSQLDPRNLYLCPVCFEAAAFQYHDLCENGNSSTEPATLQIASSMFDPLDVVERVENETKKCSNFVFRTAHVLRTHMQKFHSDTIYAPEDCRIRAFVHAHIGFINERFFHEREFHRYMSTTQSYWHSDMAKNLARYNLLVDHINGVSDTEALQNILFSVECDENNQNDDDNFVVSDSEEEAPVKRRRNSGGMDIILGQRFLRKRERKLRRKTKQPHLDYTGLSQYLRPSQGDLYVMTEAEHRIQSSLVDRENIDPESIGSEYQNRLELGRLTDTWGKHKIRPSKAARENPHSEEGKRPRKNKGVYRQRSLDEYMRPALKPEEEEEEADSKFVVSSSESGGSSMSSSSRDRKSVV